MPRVFIAAGSNLGEREMMLEQAFRALAAVSGLKPLRTAAVYETVPVGEIPQGHFLNTVWQFETSLAPEDLLQVLLACEKRLGRVRTEKNAPRTIDLDLAAYEDRIVAADGLTLPHPRLHERWFVLKPLCDLAPDWVHPVQHQSALELLKKIEEKEGLGGHRYGVDSFQLASYGNHPQS